MNNSAIFHASNGCVIVGGEALNALKNLAEKTKYNVKIATKKGTANLNDVSFGKMMFELNKYYMKYDHRTIEADAVKENVAGLLIGVPMIIYGDYGCGTKLHVEIEKAKAA